MVLTDANTTITAYNVNVTEPMTIADSNQVDIGVLQSESMTWSDSQIGIKGYNDQITETMSISSLEGVTANFAGVVSDTMVWSESEATTGWYKIYDTQTSNWVIVTDTQ